jgi:protein-disulfide isomerase
MRDSELGGYMASSVMRIFLVAVLAIAVPSLARAEDNSLHLHVLGKATAPIKVDEYVSITCVHCAEFYIKTLPELEKRYIDTGKVRIIAHDFPLSSLSLKGAAVAECMSDDEYFPFLKTIYAALVAKDLVETDFETKLYQYASLGGLPVAKAKACANDIKLQDAIVADRAEALQKYKVDATPTFVIDDGEEVLGGDPGVEGFAKVFDRLLAAKKK